MLAENLHRAGLSAVEEARGVQSMIDLGVSVSRVARSTGLGRKRVAKAAGVARLDAATATAAAAAAADLTLDQAAAVLIEAATKGPGQFAHALTRARQAREEAERVAALTGELTGAGRRLLPTDQARRGPGLSPSPTAGRS